MSIVLKSDNKKPLQPHLALTHNELQSGAANGRNVSLLLKAEDLDEETKEILKRVLGQEVSEQVIEKQSVSGKRKLLNEAVQETRPDRWSWAWVEDFDENVVVFSNSDGVFYSDYSMEGDVVTLGEPQSANSVLSWKSDAGVVVLSESDTISKSVNSLVVKSFDSIASNEKLKDVFKSKFEEGEVMEDLQKSVAELQKSLADMQSQLEKANQDKKAAEDALEIVAKAQAEAKAATRTSALKEIVAEDKVEDLQKSLLSLDDSAFETVLKSLKGSKEAVEASELFKQKSGDGADTAGSRQVFQDMLKSKYSQAK